MAPGDHSRIWFPEMSDALILAWSPDLSWQAVGDLCFAFEAQRKRIRAERGIVSPKYICKCCGELMVASETISIRSALFELRKREVIDDTTLAQLDKDWGRYRKSHKLDSQARAPKADGGREHRA